MSETFSIAYDGPALVDHQIDAKDLAGALLGLAESVDAAHEILAPGQRPVRLEIRATRGASFDVDLVVVGLDVADNLLDIAKNDPYGAMAGLGVAGTAVVTGIVSAVKLALRIREHGKPKFPITKPSDGEVKVTFRDGTTMQSTGAAIAIYNDNRAIGGIERAVRPLADGSIESLEISSTSQSVTVTPSDKPAFERHVEEPTESRYEVPMTLRLLDITFRPKGKWRVTDGEVNFYVSIDDEEFLASVEKGDERFGKTDMIRALVKVEQTVVRGELQVERTILKVLSHARGGEQMPLEIED